MEGVFIAIGSQNHRNSRNEMRKKKTHRLLNLWLKTGCDVRNRSDALTKFPFRNFFFPLFGKHLLKHTWFCTTNNVFISCNTLNVVITDQIFLYRFLAEFDPNRSKSSNLQKKTQSRLASGKSRSGVLNSGIGSERARLDSIGSKRARSGSIGLSRARSGSVGLWFTSLVVNTF